MIKRLEELTQEEIQQLIKSRQSERTVVVVHPYHNHRPSVLGLHADNEKFTKFIQGNLTQRVLTIVLDTHEGKKILELDSALGGKKQGTILWAQAESATNPRPLIGWRKFIKKLDELKAKRIIVGGRELHPYPKDAWEKRTATVKQLLKENKWNLSATKTFGEEASYLAAVAKAAKIRKQQRLLAGCAGVTAARLTTARKFRVRTTRRLT